MSAEDNQKLWDAYQAKPSMELRDKIIIAYAGLVKIVAGKLNVYLGNNVEFDDLVGYGTFGLIDAIDKFDCAKGVKFETYASLRIRGAILDNIRKMDWLPRSARQRQKKLDAAYQKLELQNGRFATDEEAAKELDISVEELEEWQSQSVASGLLSLDEYLDQGSEAGIGALGENEDYMQPEHIIEKEEIKEVLIKSLEALTDKEKRVILLYYYEDMTLREISEVLEVTESRVSQLHTKAISKLRSKLGPHIELFF